MPPNPSCDASTLQVDLQGVTSSLAIGLAKGKEVLGISENNLPSIQHEVIQSIDFTATALIVLTEDGCFAECRHLTSIACLLLVLAGVAVATQQEQLQAKLFEAAVIDLRAYAVCSLLGADAAGGEFKSGFGSVVKLPVYKDNLVVWKCTGQGITNNSNKDINFHDFDCIVIDSAGVLHEGLHTVASLTSTGSEILSCAYDLTV